MKTWREIIAEARKRGEFTDKDNERAANWNKCAVGEQRKKMTALVVKYKWGDPVDQELFIPGCDFEVAVHNNDFDQADQLLDQIEDRALQLKREVIDKKAVKA